MKFSDRYADINGFVIVFSDVDKLPKTKENALLHYVEMTCKSWTFAKMTQAEKEKIIACLFATNAFGTFRQRFEIYHAVYSTFLEALNYEPLHWRETA